MVVVVVVVVVMVVLPLHLASAGSTPPRMALLRTAPLCMAPLLLALLLVAPLLLMPLNSDDATSVYTAYDSDVSTSADATSAAAASDGDASVWGILLAAMRGTRGRETDSGAVNYLYVGNSFNHNKNNKCYKVP